MINRIPSYCCDETLSSCVIAGDFIFLAHHSAGFESQNIVEQMRSVFDRLKCTLSSVGATLDDMVQVNLYLKDLSDFQAATTVFGEYFDKKNAPVRTTIKTEFLDAECLCQIDGIAYKRKQK